MKEKQVIALFDLDIIAYRAAAAIEKRTVEVTHLKSGRSKVFKTRTEFKTFLKKQGREFIEEEYEFEDIQTPEPEEHAFQIVKRQVNTIKQEVKATAMEGFVGGKNNFRMDLDLPEKYKGQRDDMLRPIHLAACKEYALNKYPGGIIDGIEADDHLNIRSHELIRAGHDPIIISIDKDTLGCVGVSMYDWTQKDAKIIRIPKFGYLEIDKSGSNPKVRGTGINFLCYQLLKGDTADHYNPADLHKQRFGDKEVVNLLNTATDVDALFDIVKNKYQEWFPEPITYTTHDGRKVTKNHLEILEMYFSLAYMRRTREDDTTFMSYWKEMK